ncbi:hypothetical protein P9112_007040 [Eukaryota sp. TZLM1-RC]
MSLVLAVFLFSLALVDFVVGYGGGIPSAWRVSIMFLHITSVYLCVLAFIYANEAKRKVESVLALISFGVNIIAFALRIIYEITFLPFQPIQY